MKCIIKKTVDDCVTKDFIAEKINEGILQILSGGGGGGPVTIDAQISGFIPQGNGTGQTGTGSIWGYSIGSTQLYDSDTYGLVPQIESPEGHNPQCDPGIGTLVIDPLLPEDSDGTFDLNIIMIDNSGGGGHAIIFCPSTGETASQIQSVPGSFGNNTGPQPYTLTFDANELSCPPQDVLVGIPAWGVASNFEDDRCDTLSSEIGTLTTVTPSKLGAARECFKKLFCGFSIQDLVGNDTGLSKADIEQCIAEFECACDSDCEVEKAFTHAGYDYENSPNFYGSGAYRSTVNGVLTNTPWNFAGTETKSLAYQAQTDQINNNTDWIATVVSDPLMSSNDLVQWRYSYCGPAGEAAILTIVRNGGDTLQLNANTGVGTWTNDDLINLPNNPTGTISQDRQPICV